MLYLVKFGKEFDVVDRGGEVMYTGTVDQCLGFLTEHLDQLLELYGVTTVDTFQVRREGVALSIDWLCYEGDWRSCVDFLRHVDWDYEHELLLSPIQQGMPYKPFNARTREEQWNAVDLPRRLDKLMSCVE